MAEEFDYKKHREETAKKMEKCTHKGGDTVLYGGYNPAWEFCFKCGWFKPPNHNK